MQPTSERLYILFLAGYQMPPQPPLFFGYLIDETGAYIVSQTTQNIEYPDI